MGLFQSIGGFFSNFFKNAVPAVENAFTQTNSIVNILKTVLGSATAQTVEAIIEAFFPGVSNAVFGALNTFFTDYGLVSSALQGTPAEIAANGLNAIAKLTGNSKVLALSNIAAIIGHTTSTATGGNSTLQQAIAVNQVIHDPSVLSVTVPPATGVNSPSANQYIPPVPNGDTVVSA